MSAIVGTELVRGKLKSFGEHFDEYMDARLEGAVRDLQQTTAGMAPARTGTARSGILSPDAIRFEKAKGSSKSRWTFGLALTNAQGRLTFKLFWVEFGTKGYERGGERRAGRDKRGRLRTQRMKRRVPARPAHPFFRPAVAQFMVKLRQTRAVAAIFASAATAAGLEQQRKR